MKYSIDMTIKNIKADERCCAIINQFLPGVLEKFGTNPMASDLSFRKLAEFSKGMIPEDILSSIDEELNKLNDGTLSSIELEQIKLYQEMNEQREQVVQNRQVHKQDAIYPGQVWLDTNGCRIQAHAGAVFYEDGKYYWYGENKEFTTGKSEIWSWGIRCYQSQDLCNWEDLGLIIEPDISNPDSNLFPNAYVDRPHIIKCEQTSKYVCWIKLSGNAASFIVLTADKLIGPYSVVHENYRPFDLKVGDFDIHVDKETGKAYLFEAGNHDGVFGMELSYDYTSCEKIVSQQYEELHPPFTREGITLFECDSKKYLVTSGMTGYIPNQSDAAVSESWETPFVSIGNPHIDDESNASFNSQISQIFKIHGTEQLVAIADRWMPECPLDGELSNKLQRVVASTFDPDKYSVTEAEREEVMTIQSKDLRNCNTSISDYIWLPVIVKDGKVCIEWVDRWVPKLDE